MIELLRLRPGRVKLLRVFLFHALLLISFLSAIPVNSDEFFVVAKVIDGDTVELSNGERLRYIGIDTPEKQDEFYQEAKNLNRRLVEGKRIRVEFDVQKKDKYGRLLGYVYVDKLFVNAQLLKAGLAVLYTYPPNVKYANYLKDVQKEARRNKLGIWSEQIQPENYYLAAKKSKRFHRPDCRALESTKAKNIIKFENREVALDKGYSPCRICKP